MNKSDDKEMVPRPEQEEVVPGSCEESIALTGNNFICKYLFSTLYSNFSLISYCTSNGPLNIIIQF